MTYHFPQVNVLLYSQLAAVIAKESQNLEDGSARPVDMAQWMSRVALEIVGRGVLGYSFDPLDSPYNNPYTSAVKELMCVENFQPLTGLAD